MTSTGDRVLEGGAAPDVVVEVGRVRVSVGRGVDAATLATVLAVLGVEGVR
jgi:hypothetical protein